MLNRTHILFAAALLVSGALSAGAPDSLRAAARSPFPAPSQGPRVEIVVGGDARPQYPARGAWYVEALKGRDYEIRLTNPYPVRVAVALSVDGLNTIDARHTTATEARKWVLGPFETVTISGWQTGLAHARRFTFTTEEQSYGQALGRTANLGVISAVFFRERPAPPLPVTPFVAERLAGAAGRDAGDNANKSRREAESRPMASGQASAAPPAADDYAATGMGRQTDHRVQFVSLDLEDAPAASVSIRYEYRAQLVRLGILPSSHADDDPLARRQRAKGFEPGFCPEPKREW